VPETLNLRKDEPHPVTGLASLPQLGTHLIVNRILGVHETLEVVGIVHKSSWCPLPTVRNYKRTT